MSFSGGNQGKRNQSSIGSLDRRQRDNYLEDDDGNIDEDAESEGVYRDSKDGN